MFTVLLLGAGGNAGINFTKSLRKGIPDVRIVGVDLDRYNLVACNADEKVLVTAKNAEEKLAQYRALIAEHRIDFVHAQPDPEVRFLLEHRDLFARVTFDHDLEVWRRFADKLACQRTWNEKLSLGFESLGLPALLETPARFERLLAGSGKAWIRATRGAGSRAALPITSLEQAKSWADYWVATRGMSLDDFMVAEYLPGREYAVQTFWVKGKLVQSQARCRLVYFFGSIMPSGQSSTPAVAATIDERDVYDTAYAAIRAVDPSPHGIYCVDLKRDHTDAVVPMEVNYGRFFTTSDFFASIGVNTPAALVEQFRSGKVEESIERVKKRYVWIRGLDREPYLHEEA